MIMVFQNLIANAIKYRYKRTTHNDIGQRD